jgi:hypothetical protein
MIWCTCGKNFSSREQQAQHSALQQPGKKVGMHPQHQPTTLKQLRKLRKESDGPAH